MRARERERGAGRTQPACLTLEVAVSAAVEEERLALGRVPELDDLPDDDDVVTRVVLGHRLAVDVRERVGEDRARP